MFQPILLEGTFVRGMQGAREVEVPETLLALALKAMETARLRGTLCNGDVCVCACASGTPRESRRCFDR